VNLSPLFDKIMHVILWLEFCEVKPLSAPRERERERERDL
jgi:hypothetical protein